MTTTPATPLLPVTPELLPCPFCGTNSLRIIEVAPIASNYRRVSHDADKAGFGCFVSGPIRVGEDEAIAAWNTRNPAHSLPGDVGMREAAQAVIDTADDYYTARNGRRCSIEGGDGEKCWIVPFDQFEALRRAVTAIPSALSGDAGEGCLARASREAIELIDELNERATSRKFWGISQTMHNKLCTIRVTLARALPSHKGAGE